MKLRDIAYSRSGDKNDTSNIVVFPYDESDFEALKACLTVDLVRDKFDAIALGTITRYELPGLRGLNFVLQHALGGGGSMTLRSDTMGKTFQSLILDIEIEMPVAQQKMEAP